MQDAPDAYLGQPSNGDHTDLGVSPPDMLPPSLEGLHYGADAGSWAPREELHGGSIITGQGLDDSKPRLKLARLNQVKDSSSEDEETLKKR